MQLTDHIQYLLRSHDCVIIPDFGGLIADYEPARLHPVRHTLAPPTKRVAFNQALTRNDGLLVDAISETTAVGAAQARQQVREAVARMQQELQEQQRTELPGIGIFRQLPGSGLDFEYTGQQNLLSASFGLPELTSRPVRATDALLARERNQQPAQPILSTGRRRGLRRWVTSGLLALSLGLTLVASYQTALSLDNLPDEWRVGFFKPEPGPAKAVVQSANLGTPVWTETTVPDGTPEVQPEIGWPAEAPVTSAEEAATPAAPAKAATPFKAAASVTPKAAVASATISGVTNRFYVVVGSFNTWNSVNKARKNMIAHGKPARVLLPRRGNKYVKGSRYFRLTVADFASQAAAKQSLPALRQQFGKDIMVLNY